MRIFSFIAIFRLRRGAQKHRRETRERRRVADFRLAVSSCLRVLGSISSPALFYCFGVVAGVLVVLAVALCFRCRGLAFIASPPPVVNVTICGSPGTLASVKLSPTFFARNYIAWGAPSIIIVTAV